MTTFSFSARKAIAVALAVSTGVLPIAQAAPTNYEYRVAYPGLQGGPSLPGEGGGTDGPPTDGGGTDPGAGGGTATLVAATGSASFGDVSADGTAYSVAVVLTNSGTVPTTAISASTSSTGFSVDSAACSAGLTAGASCALTVWFQPSAAGTYAGTLQVQASTGGQLSLGLSGTGRRAQLALTPSTLSFAAARTGTTSDSKALTLTNSGNAAASLTGVGVSLGASDYGQSNNCGTSLAAGATCDINVSFTPSAAGTRNGAVSVTVAGAQPLTSALTGEGRSVELTLSPSDLDLGDVNVGKSSAVKSVSIQNPSDFPVSLSGLGISSNAEEFAQSNNCGAQLAAQASCDVSVQFTPTSGGARAGSLAIVSDAGTYTANLTGTGHSLSAYLDSVNFPLTDVGAQATVQATLRNMGSSSISLSVPDAESVTGTDFSFAGTTCPSTLEQGASCTVTVRFSPTEVAPRNGNLTVNTEAGTKTVSVSGMVAQGIANMSAESLDFQLQPLSTTSNMQTLTVTNTGTGTLVFSGVGISDGSSDFAQSNTCASVAVNQTCTVNVTFTPSAVGSRTGALSFVHNGGGVQTVSLAGTGAQGVAEFSPSSHAFGNVQRGGQVSQPVTVTNNGNAPLTLTGVVVTTGSPNFLRNTVCTGVTVAAGESCTFTASYGPRGTGPHNGVITVSHNGSGDTTISLSGTGFAQSGELSTPTFSATAVGASSNTTVTLSNTGVGVLAVTAPTAASVTGAGFSFVSTTCDTAVPVSGNCSVTVRFSPTSTATASGTLSVDTGAGIKTVPLGSTGIQGYASISPGSLTFDTTPTGTTSAVQTITVTNTGTSTLTFTGVGISEGATDYAQSNNCGAVAINGTCTVNVSFTPSATGTRTGTLAFTHNGGGIATVNLTGTGQAASALTASGQEYVPSGELPVFASSGTTIKNVSATPLTLLSVTLTQGAPHWQLNFFGCFDSEGEETSTLAPGAECWVGWGYQPQSAGTHPAQITVNHTGAGGTLAIPLTGSAY